MALLGALVSFTVQIDLQWKTFGFNYSRSRRCENDNLTDSHLTSKLPGDIRNFVPVGRGEPQGGAPLLSSWFSTPVSTCRYMIYDICIIHPTVWSYEPPLCNYGAPLCRC